MEHDFTTLNPHAPSLSPQAPQLANFQILLMQYIVLCFWRRHFVYVDANGESRSLMAEYCYPCGSFSATAASCFWSLHSYVYGKTFPAFTCNGNGSYGTEERQRNGWMFTYRDSLPACRQLGCINIITLTRVYRLLIDVPARVIRMSEARTSGAAVCILKTVWSW